jgi:hypothetical protein
VVLLPVWLGPSQICLFSLRPLHEGSGTEGPPGGGNIIFYADWRLTALILPRRSSSIS